MYVRKEQAGSAPGHTWEEDGQVIEVDDELAEQLLAIPNGGFSEAAPPPAEPEKKEEPGEESGEEEPEEDETSTKKKGGRPRLPRDEKGNIIRPNEISE